MPTIRVSTEVLFLLPAKYGIFWKTYGIPPDSEELRGIFTLKFTRNSAEFRVYLFTEFRSYLNDPDSKFPLE